MGQRDRIEMSLKDLKRVKVIYEVIQEKIKQREAAELIQLSTRQVRRIQRRVEREGDPGVIHRSRWKPSHNQKQDEFRGKVMQLYHNRYADFGPTLASEKLLELDHLPLSRETLRLWLKQENIQYPRRKKRPHRQWRERKPHYGEMQQVDGSHHEWFEGRGPECVLMSFVDDATGRVFAQFYEYEGVIPVMDCFEHYVRRYGLPMSLYLDKHTTYRSNAKLTLEEQLQGYSQPLSEFERAMQELQVKVIHANSPQAKGRVERSFNTFQDRVIKEMRLKDVKNITQANAFLKVYLPLYNKRFAVPPAKQPDLHRQLPPGFRLDRILCVKALRTLRNDFTLSYHNHFYQLLTSTRTKKLWVLEKLNGTIEIMDHQKSLLFKNIPAPLHSHRIILRSKPLKPYVPPSNHPWKLNITRAFNMRQHQQKQLLEAV